MKNLSNKRKEELIKFCDWYLENVTSMQYYYICSSYINYFKKPMPLYLYRFMFKYSSIFKNANDIKNIRLAGICLFVGRTERKEFIEILKQKLELNN